MTSREPVENKGSKRRNNFALECSKFFSWDHFSRDITKINSRGKFARAPQQRYIIVGL